MYLRLPGEEFGGILETPASIVLARFEANFSRSECRVGVDLLVPYRFTVKVDGLALEPSEKFSWTSPRVPVGALFSDCPPAVRLVGPSSLQVADHKVYRLECCCGRSGRSKRPFETLSLSHLSVVFFSSGVAGFPLQRTAMWQPYQRAPPLFSCSFTFLASHHLEALIQN